MTGLSGPASLGASGMVSDVIVVALAVGAGAVALVLAIVLATWGQRDPEPDPADEPDLTPEDAEPDPAALREQAHELAVHAAAATVRAEAAAAELEAAQAAYARAEEHRATVEARYDAAREAYTQALAELRAAAPADPPPEQRAHRRQVESAGLAAFRRGELSFEELRAVFAWVGDRDPDREALAHEVQRLAEREGEARREYDIAAAGTRLAGERLHVADVAAAATAQEAVHAAVEAQLAADSLPPAGAAGFLPPAGAAGGRTGGRDDRELSGGAPAPG